MLDQELGESDIGIAGRPFGNLGAGQLDGGSSHQAGLRKVCDELFEPSHSRKPLTAEILSNGSLRLESQNDQTA